MIEGFHLDAFTIPKQIGASGRPHPASTEG
jgi:hypothetical protein